MHGFRNYIYALVACALAGLALEVITRTFRPTPPLPDFNEIGWNAVTSPARQSPTADPNFVRNTEAEINQLISRGRRFSPDTGNRIKVLLVGDSQVESAALPFGNLPEIELERALNAEFGQFFDVRSIASSGWGQAEQLLALRRYFADFRADYILLWHTPRNDFWENAFPDRSTADRLGPLKPAFVLAPDGLKQFSFEPYKGDRPGLLAASHVYRRVHRIAEQAGLFDQPKLLRDFNSLIPPPGGHVKVAREKCPNTVVDLAKYAFERSKYGFTPVSIETSEAISSSRSHFSPFLKTLSERDKYLVDITRALFGEIDRLARANYAKLVVFFSNQTYKDGAHAWVAGSCAVESGGWYELADVAERASRTLADLDVLELNAAHRDISYEEVTVSPSDRHLNELGNQLVFRELAAALRRKGLVPAPSQIID